MINYINELFNTREIAKIIWLLILLVIVIFIYINSSKAKKIILDLLEMFSDIFKHIISITIIFVFLLISFSFVFFDIFSIISFKDYFIWYFFVFVPMIIFISNSDNLFTMTITKMFFASIKLSVIPYFIINYYPFNLGKELIIVLLIGILSMFSAISEINDKYKIFNIFINIILITIAFVMFFYALKEFGANISDIYKSEFWIYMFLDIILIFIHTPFLYFFRKLSEYEEVLSRINRRIKVDKSKSNNRKVISIIFKRCKFHRKKLYFLYKNFGLVEESSNYNELNSNIKVLLKKDFKKYNIKNNSFKG